LEQWKLGSPVPTTCDHTAALAGYLGGSVMGLRVLDSQRLLDYLGTRPEVDRKRIGAMGISGGGMLTFYAACLDERIKACVISGYYCSFKYSILGMHHCTCNYIPGLARFGDMHDLIGMIAPRPVLVEAGNKDPIFPLPGVKRCVALGRKVYDVWDAVQNLQTDYFDGRHRINGCSAYPFLQKNL